MMKKIRLLIIEEHAAVRHALEVRLRSSARIELVAATSSLEEGREFVHTLHPEVTLVGCKGSRDEQLFWLVEAVQEMVEQGTIVVALASYGDEIEREMLLQAGVSRYFLKDINTPQLINEMESVLKQRRRAPRSIYAADYSLPPAPSVANGSLLGLDSL